MPQLRTRVLMQYYITRRIDRVVEEEVAVVVSIQSTTAELATNQASGKHPILVLTPSKDANHYQNSPK